MPQAGLHGIVGAYVRRWTPRREWLFLGLVLGVMFPDLDNIAVAVATVAKLPKEGLHRTFTHSIFTIAAILVLFYLVAALTKQARWKNLGFGLGIGTGIHILMDLIGWFNGVEILWPIPYELNFWTWYTPPEWLNKLLETAEFLFFGLFFAMLVSLARRSNTDTAYLPRLRFWVVAQFILFALFTVLAFTMTSGYFTIYGVLYLLSLFLAFGISIRMRKTIEMLA
jgi:membrane-bound metal-dependent hydrolase YbcI (DUF457 family)